MKTVKAIQYRLTEYRGLVSGEFYSGEKDILAATRAELESRISENGFKQAKFVMERVSLEPDLVSLAKDEEVSTRVLGLLHNTFPDISHAAVQKIYLELADLLSKSTRKAIKRKDVLEVVETNKISVPYLVKFQAPSLPEHFVPRLDVVALFKERFLTLKTSNGVLSITGIHAMGGSGKTLTAIYLAHEFQGNFRDGVLWTELGRDLNPQKRLEQLYRWIRNLSSGEPRPESEQDATDKLRDLLKDRSFLLVLDDVWEADHARPFLVGGSTCHVLITCRRKIESKDFSPRYFILPEMKMDQSFDLLQGRLGRQIELSEKEEVEKLVRATGFLPLALDLIAARIAQSGKTWADFYYPLEALGSSRRNKENQLQTVLNASLVILHEEDEQAWKAFIWLGVLPRGVLIAAPMASTIWEVDLDVADEILEDLAKDALLNSGQKIEIEEKQWRSYRIYDLLYDLVVQLLNLDQTGKYGRKALRHGV